MYHCTKELQKQALEQIHTNQKGIKKMRLLACNSIYLINMNANIKNAIKNCLKCIDFQQTQLTGSFILRYLANFVKSLAQTCSPYIVSTIFAFVYHHSKFPITKKTEGFSADSLILACKVIFAA